ncbi:MAG TPA: hypothetical protein VJN70_19060 [Gemmatimonadaceae bacterium]|nr:hypothetical protein [Gemmatimonadaceae bacterium]
MLHARFALIAVGVAVALFAAMVLFIELGRGFGVRQLAKGGNAAKTGVGVVDGAVYSLFALLIGFTFSGAAGRFDQRRQVIADETNAAGTAWQRIDVLSAELQVEVRGEFRRYMDALVAWHTKIEATDLSDEPAALRNAQNDLWSGSVAACIAPNGEKARMLLLPALNDLFGLVEKERIARLMHPPTLIWAMLAITALASALFAGYGLAGGPSRNWIYIIGVAASVSIATYVIIELEYPRLGLSRVTDVDQTLIDLRATMK